jgi:hypothetical protein
MTKLIFCFDGTCNSPDTFDDYLEDNSITNILKLHAMFGGTINPPNKTYKDLDQHSFYYSGVGTHGSKFWRTLNALIAPSFGDLDTIMESALDDLKKAFKKDGEHEIFIFGFSRGAAIARMFAASLEELEHKVKFLGVFDTVAATKGSLDLSPNTFPASGIVFENGTIGAHIERAVHLIALDEKRILFQPTLFNKDDRVTEVWFSGVHSDVGGGYWFDGLSDITLEFMINEVKKEGLSVLELDQINYPKLKPRNTVDAICADDLVINALPHGKIHLQNVDGAIDKKRLSERAPGVNVDDQRKKDEPPIIHYTVVERFKKVTNYRPYALRDQNYRVLMGDNTISEPRKGIAELNTKDQTAADQPAS